MDFGHASGVSNYVMKAYLLALEIQPVKTGNSYEGLPLHCTLVHWFWLDSVQSMTESIIQLIKHYEAPLLHVGNEEQFTGMTNNGPIPVTVNKIKKTSIIEDLHEKIAGILDAEGVEYSMPQYIHAGYVPHVTHQKDSKLTQRDVVRATSLYLAQADDPAYVNDRMIIAKFDFKDTKESI
jgi:hypothetical protein